MNAPTLFLGDLVFFLETARDQPWLTLPRAGHLESFEGTFFCVRPCQASPPTPRPLRRLHAHELYATQAAADHAVMQRKVEEARAFARGFVAVALNSLVSVESIEALMARKVGAPTGPSPLDIPLFMTNRTPLRELIARIRSEQTSPLDRASLDMSAIRAQVRARLLGQEASEEEVASVAERILDSLTERKDALLAPETAPAVTPQHERTLPDAYLITNANGALEVGLTFLGSLCEGESLYPLYRHPPAAPVPLVPKSPEADAVSTRMLTLELLANRFRHALQTIAKRHADAPSDPDGSTATEALAFWEHYALGDASLADVLSRLKMVSVTDVLAPGDTIATPVSLTFARGESLVPCYQLFLDTDGRSRPCCDLHRCPSCQPKTLAAVNVDLLRKLAVRFGRNGRAFDADAILTCIGEAGHGETLSEAFARAAQRVDADAKKGGTP